MDIIDEILNLNERVAAIEKRLGIKSEERKGRRDELMNLKMKELRKIGDELGRKLGMTVKDTSKRELVDEIIRAEQKAGVSDGKEK